MLIDDGEMGENGGMLLNNVFLEEVSKFGSFGSYGK